MSDPSKKDLVPRTQGQPPLDPAKLTVFLDALADCGNVTQAAETAGAARVTFYRYRKDDPEFAAAWDAAAEVGAHALEDEARRRGFQGWEEPVFFEGERVDTVRKYSDTLLIFLLKAHFPEKYRDRWQGELTGPGGGPIQSINLHAITGLDTDELRLLRDLLWKAAQRRGGGGGAPASPG